MINVLLVGSQPVSLAGLRALIDSEAGMEVVGQREHPNDALTSPMKTGPDVALIDHQDGDSVEPLAALARAGNDDTQCIVLTSSGDAELLSEAFRDGVRGLVFKSQAPQLLIAAIRRVHEGEIWLDRRATTQLITDLLRSANEKPRKRKPILSERDHRIIALVADGLKNFQIAEALRVSEATVRNRLTSIFKKLGVNGRLQLVVYAHQKGLVKMQLAGSRRGTESPLRLV